jgi:hypothetical protein
MSVRKQRTEIQKNYRINHGDEYRETEKLRMREKRKNMTDAEKEVERRQARERMQSKRQKTVVETSAQDSDPYATPQSFGKAVSKASNALPQDRGRRIAVIHELCKRDSLEITNHEPPKFIGTTSKEIVFSFVNNFYLRDDVSRQAPGLKDTVYVKKVKAKVSYFYKLPLLI